MTEPTNDAVQSAPDPESAQDQDTAAQPVAPAEPAPAETAAAEVPTERVAEAAPEATAEPEVVATPEPAAVPEAAIEPEVVTEPEVVAEPEAAAASEAVVEPEVSAPPAAESLTSEAVEAEIVTPHALEAEPVAEPETAAEPVSVTEPVAATEPVADATADPAVADGPEATLEALAEPVLTPVAPAPAISQPAASAIPKPGPGIAPRPGPGIAPRPGPAVAPRPPVAQAPAPAPVEATTETLPETSPYGRVDEDGTVYLTTADGERAIGSWQAGDAAAGIAFYTRKYDDVMTKARLVRDRLAAGNTPSDQALKTVAEIRETLPTADILGDIPAIEAVLAEVDTLLAKRKAERAQARQAATAVRRGLVEEAEKLVESTSWNATGDRFKAIVEEWTAAGHGDRRDEDALWKRLSAARAAFGEKRRSAFLERDRERDAARQRKEQLIREAEALSSSSEWTDTARKYRDLMDRWKAAGRAPKAEDDALWHRFRTAQDAFFARRAETFSARDAEFAGNQKAKEALLERAERIDPRSDLAGAQALLRSIQAEWEGIGKVPREVMDSLEGRLEAVEDKVREASDSRWQRQPAQDTGMLGQLRRGVAELEDKLARANARGDVKAAKAAEAELVSKRRFLEMAEQAR